MDDHCAGCGAPADGGASCRDCFDALLAYENEHPPAFGAVHHLTVACYFLQHPAGYGAEILRTWHELLRASLVAGERPHELQRRMGRRFAGSAKVRDPHASPPAHWPREWSVRVADVLRPGQQPAIEDYVTRANAWAAATLATLDASALGAH
jgi:hypothetical protein